MSCATSCDAAVTFFYIVDCFLIGQWCKGSLTAAYYNQSDGWLKNNHRTSTQETAVHVHVKPKVSSEFF